MILSRFTRNYNMFDSTVMIASRYKAVFLARLRRFGKSLLCSTIEALFRGEKELFVGDKKNNARPILLNNCELSHIPNFAHAPYLISPN